MRLSKFRAEMPNGRLVPIPQTCFRNKLACFHRKRRLMKSLSEKASREYRYGKYQDHVYEK